MIDFKLDKNFYIILKKSQVSKIRLFYRNLRARDDFLHTSRLLSKEIAEKLSS